MSDEREVIGTIKATNTFGTTDIELYRGQNSFGEPGIFCGAEPGGKKEFAGLRGYPLYAAQIWLCDRGYTYEVT